MGDPLYFDNNATTKPYPEVVEAMLPFLTDQYANPSAGYRFAVEAKKALHQAREQVAALINAEPQEIVFTGCGTESDNTALASAMHADPSKNHVITTPIEHSAILEQCNCCFKERGIETSYLAVDRDGLIDLDELSQSITEKTGVVSIMWGNNEIGTVEPIPAAAAIAAEKGVHFHTDAIQAAGKIPIDVKETDIHYLSLSAHKIHGPKGVGALYVNRRINYNPFILGGKQEDKRRAGTENIASIVGFGKAAEMAKSKLDHGEINTLAQLRDRFEEQILQTIPQSGINGKGAQRLPNTANIYFDGIETDIMMILLDQHSICCSGGSACNTGSLEPSHVLTAIGCSSEQAKSSIRFSFSSLNTEAEIDQSTPIIKDIVYKIRQARAHHAEGPVIFHNK